VDLRGGPAALIAENQPSRFTGSGGSVSVSAARLMLEILAVYDVFGSLTSGEPPYLLGPGNTKWWFSGNEISYHTLSIENVFGMSRSMIELIARVSAFVTRSTKSLAQIQIAEDESNNPDDETTTLDLQKEAEALYAEIEGWTDAEVPQDLQRRVANGNSAHQNAMKIVMLRDVFDVPRQDERVQTASDAIIARCFESTKGMGMAVDLTWPVIIAGCQVSGEQRAWVAATFEGFREQCCFEIDTAEQIVCEVWSREDAGMLSRANWRAVVEDLNLRCLLI